jgi:hypothetical protein
MHRLNTGLITAQYPTQILGESFGTRFDEQTSPIGVAYVSVEIDGVSHVCEVEAKLSFGATTGFDASLFDEWAQLMENNEVVPRTVTLAAEPSDDILGTAHFAIRQIDLRVEEGESRFFADVVK